MAEEKQLQEFGLKEVWDRTDNLTEELVHPLTQNLLKSLERMMELVHSGEGRGDLTVEVLARRFIRGRIASAGQKYRDADGSWKPISPSAQEDNEFSKSHDDNLASWDEWPHRLVIPVSAKMKSEFEIVAKAIRPELAQAERDFLHEALTFMAFCNRRKEAGWWLNPR